MVDRLVGQFVDVEGRVVLAGPFLDPQPFEDGCARVTDREGGTYLIDRHGTPLFGERYDAIDRLHEGFLNTRMGDRCGVVRKDGKLIVEPRYETMFLPADGRVTFVDDGKCGFLDLEGRVVVQPTWSVAGWHCEGLAVVRVDGKFGYVDLDGTMVIEPAFDEATVFSNGRARVCVDEQWGVIDRAGSSSTSRSTNRSARSSTVCAGRWATRSSFSPTEVAYSGSTHSTR